jgi:VWFA-related protein
MSIMPRDASRALAGAAVAVALALGGAAGADPVPQAPPAGAPAPGAPEYHEEVSVSWILVPVIVKSPKGYVNDLERGDFELRVDGRPVRFADFERRGEAAWSLVVLQDLSGSMGVGGRLDASREAARFFLDHARVGDEFALATFAAGAASVDVPFTENLEALRESVATWEAYGKTALHDAVSRLPEISGTGRNVKRAALLVTDGVDNASAISAGEARELVRRAELPVYVLGLESGDPYEVDADGHKVYRYADVLNLLAALTGGRYFPIRGPDDLKEACATIADDLRYQYVLGFDTSGRGEAAYRPISVTIKGRPELKIQARRGYRGTPPAR